MKRTIQLLTWFTRAFVFSGMFVAITASAAGPLEISHPAVQAVMAVQGKVTGPLMTQLPDIIGTAVGSDAAGNAVLKVYVDVHGPAAAAIARAMPQNINGTGVEVEFTEKFEAFIGKPSRGTSHTAKQTPPIKLGTSGGWKNDLANGYCCGGTLGSLVQVSGNTTEPSKNGQYILSNYHVTEADIVPGGNGITATTDSYVIQPGLIDVGCNANNAQNVGTLVKLSSLPGSNVDVGVAKVIVVDSKPMVSPQILEIGTLSSTTVEASIGQAVKKSGRTTGLTRSSVSGLNATVSVAYENECAGGAAFTKTFTGQIIIGNTASKFLNSGDSGSTMVEDVTTNPRAVGLLYAGNSSLAVANPIDEVLAFIGTKLGSGPTSASMVGN
jgi:hypothetical protein